MGQLIKLYCSFNLSCTNYHNSHWLTERPFMQVCAKTSNNKIIFELFNEACKSVHLSVNALNKIYVIMGPSLAIFTSTLFHFTEGIGFLIKHSKFLHNITHAGLFKSWHHTQGPHSNQTRNSFNFWSLIQPNLTTSDWTSFLLIKRWNCFVIYREGQSLEHDLKFGYTHHLKF